MIQEHLLKILPTLPHFTSDRPEFRTLLVAVSGGRDSMALIHALHAIRETLDLKLVVCTIDHGIRGEEAVADTQFVADWCTAHNILCEIRTADVPAQAAMFDHNLEHTARVVRYGLLAKVAEQHNAVYILTAHHADDNAETVLLHLFRGAALSGLGGMGAMLSMIEHFGYSAFVNDYEFEVYLVRPLLDVTRTDVEEYIVEHAIPYRDDSTNLDLSYSRNRLRHFMHELHGDDVPHVVRSITRTAALLAEDYALLEALLMRIVHREQEYIWFSPDDLIEPSRAMKRMIIRYAHDWLAPIDHLTAAYVERGVALIDSLIANEKRDANPTLDKLIFMRDGSRIAILDAESTGPGLHDMMSRHTPIELVQAAALNAHGDSSYEARPEYQDYYFVLTRSNESASELPDKLIAQLILSVPPDAMLAIRAPRPDDRLQIQSEPPLYKRIMDILSNAHVPRTWRKWALVVTSDDRPIGVIAHRIGGDLFARVESTSPSSTAELAKVHLWILTN